jgi:hypothetical protein
MRFWHVIKEGWQYPEVRPHIIRAVGYGVVALLCGIYSIASIIYLVRHYA